MSVSVCESVWCESEICGRVSFLWLKYIVSFSIISMWFRFSKGYTVANLENVSINTINGCFFVNVGININYFVSFGRDFGLSEFVLDRVPVIFSSAAGVAIVINFDDGQF